MSVSVGLMARAGGTQEGPRPPQLQGDTETHKKNVSQRGWGRHVDLSQGANGQSEGC